MEGWEFWEMCVCECDVYRMGGVNLIASFENCVIT